jgi:hypothetical protein
MRKSRWRSAANWAISGAKGNRCIITAWCCYAASKYSECINRCRESIRLLERMGDYWQVHVARYQIAASYYRLGELSSAIEESRKNHQSGVYLGDEQASGIIFDVWARAAHGNVPEEMLERELTRDRFDAQGTAQVLFASAVCQLSQGQLHEASERLEKAIGVITEAGVCNSYTLPIRVWAVTAYRTAGGSRGRLHAPSAEALPAKGEVRRARRPAGKLAVPKRSASHPPRTGFAQVPLREDERRLSRFSKEHSDRERAGVPL